MAMPLCRVRQIVEIIGQRRALDLRVEAAMIEWHAKHVASVSAMDASAGKTISGWKLMPDEILEVDPLTAEDEIERVVEQGSQTAADDPRNAVAVGWLEHALAGPT